MNWRATVLQKIVCVSIVGLVILFGFKEQVGSSSASFTISSTAVMLSGARVRQSNPAAADFDGDGIKRSSLVGRTEGYMSLPTKEAHGQWSGQDKQQMT